MRRLRLGDLRKLFADRCRGFVLPDDGAGREYLVELLLPISLGPNEAVKRSRVEIWGPTDRMRREVETWAPWMSEDETEELLTEINLMPTWQRKPMARTVAERLNVTYPERTRLGLRTIGACDMTEEAMVVIRKQKRRQRDKLRRQRQPRAEYLAASLAQTKPWEQEGISKRTWERRRVAGVHHINLIKTSRILATEGKTEADAGLCDRLPTATPAGQVQTYPEFLTADEAAWLVDAICPSDNVPNLEAA